MTEVAIDEIDKTVPMFKLESKGATACSKRRATAVPNSNESVILI